MVWYGGTTVPRIWSKLRSVDEAVTVFPVAFKDDVIECTRTSKAPLF